MARVRSRKSLLMQALTARGYEVDHNASTTKYVAMKKMRHDVRFFIGQTGELRVGTDVSSSRLNADAQVKLLAEAEAKNAGSDNG